MLTLSILPFQWQIYHLINRNIINTIMNIKDKRPIYCIIYQIQQKNFSILMFLNVFYPLYFDFMLILK